MRVLVTGSSGFLGRHVVRHFASEGWIVRGFDVSILDEPGVEFHQGDLTEANSVDQAAKGCDVIAHIGAIGDVYLAGNQPALASEVNVVGTANVVEAALRSGSRIVYASTWEVYGKPIREPIEEDHPTMPDHPYSITKLAGESLLLSACRLRGLSAMALRLGTAYGTGLRRNSVFRIFIDKARRGEPITIQGDGSQGRQFTHASDIARGFELAARSDESDLAVNIVSPQVVTIKELADMITTHLPAKVEFGPPRPGDVPAAVVSPRRAGEILGWNAEVPFDEGLAELIAEA